MASSPILWSARRGHARLQLQGTAGGQEEALEQGGRKSGTEQEDESRRGKLDSIGWYRNFSTMNNSSTDTNIFLFKQFVPELNPPQAGPQARPTAPEQAPQRCVCGMQRIKGAIIHHLIDAQEANGLFITFQH